MNLFFYYYYSIPSPLNFNNDNIPDFLVRFNKGKWMMYDYSYMAVIDGSNGELLWSLNCSLGAMGSAITVKSNKPGHDGILFLASGCEEKSKIMKKNVENLEVFQKQDDNICPSFHWGMEPLSFICLSENRDKRHGDESEKHNEGDSQSSDNFGPQVFRPSGIDFSELMDDIPTDLWKATDDTDKFPNPSSDTRSFIQDYCNIPYDRLISRVYFLTPNMIKLGKIEPIIENKPYVYSKLAFCLRCLFYKVFIHYIIDLTQNSDGSYVKRHNHPAVDDSIQGLLKNRKSLRCAHILVPLMLATTPRLGDFNVDEKLDVALAVNFNSFPNELYALELFHPPRTSINVFSIEDKVKEIFGPDIEKIVDFTSYYSLEKQPWSQYMGSRGDCVYETPETTST